MKLNEKPKDMDFPKINECLSFIQDAFSGVNIYRKGWVNLYDEIVASEKCNITETDVDAKYWKARLKTVLEKLESCGFVELHKD